MRKVLCCLVSSLCVASLSSIAAAQTDFEVDAAHHKLEFENNCVKVVRGNFGPHEKSAALFDTKDAVIVELTGSEGFKLTFPDGNSITLPAKYAGQVSWAPAGRIQPENTSDTRVEYIAIEPKGKSCN
jgi:hypothetical protein